MKKNLAVFFSVGGILLLAAEAHSAGFPELSPRPFPQAQVSNSSNSSNSSLEVPIRFDEARRSFSVSIPEDAISLVIERRGLFGSWRKWKTVRIHRGMTSYSMRVPAKAVPADWRAFVQIPSGTPAPGKKYPAAFYRGSRNFSPAASSGYADAVLGDPAMLQRDFLVGAVTLDSFAGTPQSNLASSTPAAKVQEADIWKTEGTTVFFFNQLRGLQVLDLSNPSNPSMVCSLRLPAVGQDLYVIGSTPESTDLLLLTRDAGIAPATRIHLVRVEEGKARIVAETLVPGNLADSRMKGNRLFVASFEWIWNGSGADGFVWLQEKQTFLQEVIVDPLAGSLSMGVREGVSGFSPIVSAGDDWLAVAGGEYWAASEITLFSLDEQGLQRLTPSPIQTTGRIQDKFKIQYSAGVLTAISQTNWPRVTTLENFSPDGTKLASLEIVRDESLFATRFAGDKAYAVTFRQTDPLWVLDLSDPASPAISGHLEVPGWSTHLEPLGDMLFAIGQDSGRVEVSLFDVSDPANPTLASRIPLTGGWGYSEALDSEKALKFLHDQNLALVPFTDYSAPETTQRHKVQLIEWNLQEKSLQARGTIQHSFEPRRAAMVAGALASISQRQLVTADIADRDNPSVLADVMLAWPVHRVEHHNGHLLQISEGGSWLDESPAIRISTGAEPDLVLGEIALEPGSIRDALVLGDRLHVLRTTGISRIPFWRDIVVFAEPTSPGPLSKAALWLDTYDLSRLPAVTKIGSASVPLDEKKSWQTSALLTPSANSCAVLLQQTPRSRWFFPGPIRPLPIVIDPVESAAMPRIDTASLSVFVDLPRDLRVEEPDAARVVVFDVSKSSRPALARSLTLPKNLTVCLRTAQAADGLVLFGAGQKSPAREIARNHSRLHYIGIIDAAQPSSPSLRRIIDIPGRVLCFSDVNRAGFLVWSEGRGEAGILESICASACDLSDVYEIDSVFRPEIRAASAHGRSLYLSVSNSISRLTLSNAGRLLPDGEKPLKWTPSSLRPLADRLLATDGVNLLAVPFSKFPVDATVWKGTWGLDPAKICLVNTETLASPAGERGVDIFTSGME